METGIPKPSEAILGAASPTDALNVIAAVLDQFSERIFDLEECGSGNGWTEWTRTDSGSTSVSKSDWSPNPADEEELVRLTEALQGNEDADESKVLRAKIELCKDRLKPPLEVHDNSGELAELTHSPDGTVVVNLPPPTPEQIDFRGQMLLHLGLIDQYGEELGRQFEDSFLKGGPLLLYYSDRDFVMSLPDGIKREMIVDVEKSSNREAHEMARDLLRVNTDESNDLEAAKARIFGDVESGAVHNAP